VCPGYFPPDSIIADILKDRHDAHGKPMQALIDMSISAKWRYYHGDKPWFAQCARGKRMMF
jgi:hypothetical protein